MNEPVVSYENWGINPAYQTPAYMANFRPAYVDELKKKARKLKDEAARASKKGR